MKRKRRCNLCGAKLNGDICSECGYNNAAYDYEAGSQDGQCRHSSAEAFYDGEDHQKHVDPESETWDYSQVEDLMDHEFEKKYESVPNREPSTYGLNQDRKKKKRNVNKLILVLILICWFLPTVVGVIGALFFQIRDRINSFSYGISEPELRVEETVQGTLSEDRFSNADERKEAAVSEEAVQNAGQKNQMIPAEAGGPFETVLGPGIYVAGIQVPVGVYYGELTCGSGSVCVWNEENSYWESSYLYEDGGKDNRIMKELKLSAGTALKIMDDAQLAVSTRANEGYIQREHNPQTEAIPVSDGMVVGEDIPAGTYRVCDQTQTEAYHPGQRALIHKYVSSYDEEVTENIIFTEENSEYQNLILKEGDVLVKLNSDLSLEPAEYDISELVQMW